MALAVLVSVAAVDQSAWAARDRGPVARQVVRHRPLRIGPFLRYRVPRREPTLLAPLRPDENLIPPFGEPSPLFDDQISSPPSLPHSFALTVPVRGSDRPAVPATLGRYVEVGRALSVCWAPPPGAAWSAVTVRLAFRRDGTIYGVPRIAFVDAETAEAKSALAQSLLAALKACKPLPFSASLGAAVAGEIFAIRFVHQD